ncbi:hypothetical protein OIU78_013802 [Salix suchowensis]|nr:hypothetical protein OIU78_013802 [Salix suchowensis]
MGFTGTLEKCKACDKTVYFIELVSADGVPYHKKCFKCSHCNGLLVMSSYSSIDGVLYCKPHYDQLFKETANFTTKLQSSGEKKNGLTKAPSKLSSMFSGTQDKCASCKKTAYPLEKVSYRIPFLSHNSYVYIYTNSNGNAEVSRTLIDIFVVP